MAKKNGAFECFEDIIGEVDNQEEAIKRCVAYLNGALKFPVEVTGIEDFGWEEIYIVGGGDPDEWAEERKTSPSYEDVYDLKKVEYGVWSKWVMCCGEDAVAHVVRKSDKKKFILGLSELKTTEESGDNFELIDAYSVWFWNSR